MIQIPVFLDKIVQFPKRYFLKNNANGTVTLEESPGEVAQVGTPISAAAMNAIRDGIYQSTPVSAVMHFARNTPPDGWLECNGAAVSRTIYSDLFTTIGTTFGLGNGSTTFNLPDLRGEFIRGWDNGRGVDSGRVLGSNQEATRFSIRDSGSRYVGNGEDFKDVNAPTAGSSSGGTTNSTAVRPRNIALLACIKY